MKISFVTGSRAEFGITRNIVRSCLDRGLDAGYLVCGSHLMVGFEKARNEVLNSKLPIYGTVTPADRTDDPEGVCLEMGHLLRELPALLKEIAPDILFATGDRHEMTACVIGAHVLGIPVAHLHGGELSYGAIDEGFRHAMSKLSVIHFTSTKAAKARLIQMGEAPNHIHHVGAPALSSLDQARPKKGSTLGRDLLTGIALNPDKPVAILTVHPVTANPGEAELVVDVLADALNDWPELQVLVTWPNADAGGFSIRRKLKRLVEDRRHWVGVESLGIDRYYAVLEIADLMVGNSSSGIIESASFGLPTVNVGTRQQGRDTSANTLSCRVDADEVRSRISQALSHEFRFTSKNAKNIYYVSGSAKTIARILADYDINKLRQPKVFYEQCNG